jgi:flagellar FliL protein
MSDKKPNNIIVILLIVLIVVLVGIAGFFGYLYAFKGGKSTAKAETQTAAPKEQTASLDEFITNLADTDQRVYIKTKIYVSYTTTGLDKEITSNMSQIRDGVNSVLRSKTYNDFNTTGINKVKKEMIDKINSYLKTGKIDNLYFYEIVIQ